VKEAQEALASASDTGCKEMTPMLNRLTSSLETALRLVEEALDPSQFDGPQLKARRMLDEAFNRALSAPMVRMEGGFMHV
jgi:hypothetical protein